MFNEKENDYLNYLLGREEDLLQVLIAETKNNEARELYQDEQYLIASILKKINK